MDDPRRLFARVGGGLLVLLTAWAIAGLYARSREQLSRIEALESWSDRVGPSVARRLRELEGACVTEAEARAQADSAAESAVVRHEDEHHRRGR